MILGFDTATPDTVVATRTGEGGAERLLAPANGRPVHGTALLPAIEEVVAESGGWGEVASVAVGIGPGSFTGLRIGVATARALAQSRGLLVAGVPSTAALAGGIPAAGREALAVIDARRGEVFAAIGEGDAVVCAPGDLAAHLDPERLQNAVAAGDGAIRFRSEIEGSGALVLPDGDPAHGLSARRICELAAKVAPVDPGAVRPLYLRRPDAERWRERDGSN